MHVACITMMYIPVVDTELLDKAIQAIIIMVGSGRNRNDMDVV